MKLSNNDTLAILVIIALNSALFVNFQTTQAQPTTNIVGAQEHYQSPINGYAITLYPGFVIHDISQSAINRGVELLQSLENFEHIGTVCLEQDSTPSFGGTVECEPSGGESATLQSGAEIKINRFSDLLARPELQ